MPTIDSKNRYLTLINVFTVAPERQQELVELLVQATAGRVRQAPGFVSASLHRSLDSTRVTMYAQWRSREDYERMRASPDASPYLAQALTFTTFEPGMYEVAATFEPSEPS